MKPISINLASRPFYNQTLYLVTFIVSAVLLIGMTGLNLYTFFVDQSVWGRFRDTRDQMQADLRALDRQATAQERDLNRLDLTQVTQQSDFANDAILQRVFSWTLLFNRLEEVMPPAVKLSSIRPRLGEGSIHFRVVGTAKEPEAFTEFEDNLLKSPLFSEVYPISERVSSTGRGIDFSLSFGYLVGGEAEGSDEVPAPATPEDESVGPGEAEPQPAPGATRAAAPAPQPPAAPAHADREGAS